MTEDGFFSFLCPNCHSELEVTPDMIGEHTDCPACGAGITIPKPEAAEAASGLGADGIVRHGQGDGSSAKSQALKGRTIRIELGDF
ncbi:MAG: hypothetical protein J6P13_07745 [Kiritimatiellae bacterium]|nr:hypothetical protein [Kiritimatiellia bacterium]